jgi:hypothetical protein
VYNRMFSILSTFIDNGRHNGVERRNGDSAVTINGSVRYYFHGDVESCKGGLSYFLYDGLDKLLHHGDALNDSQSSSDASMHGERINSHFLRILFSYLQHCHPYCGELLQIGKTIKQHQTRCMTNEPTTESTHRLEAEIVNSEGFLEVAAFTADNVKCNRQYKFKLRGQVQTLDMRNKLVEPLSYPLIFSCGEDGWSTSVKGSASFLQYLGTRLLLPEKNWVAECTYIHPVTGELATAPTPIGRFQLLSRVGQHYLTECVARMIDYRLQWHRNNQATIFGEKYASRLSPSDLDHDNGGGSCEDNTAAVDPERAVANNSSPSFLADSFTGSPRHLKLLAINALTIVSHFGAPTVFVTLTVNPKWSEIVCRCFPGQGAYDRGDVAVPVFKGKLKMFLQRLRQGAYFGGGKPVYLMYVIEYQHRGMPHAHIVARLTNHPTTLREKVEWVDKYISARCPCPDTDPDYHRLVQEHEVHHCSRAVNGCINSAGILDVGHINYWVNV